MRSYRPRSTDARMGAARKVLSWMSPDLLSKTLVGGRTHVTAAERSAERTGPITDHASYDVAR